MTPDADIAEARTATPARPATKLLLAAVLLVGAYLRIHGFDDPGLWIDEYGTWWVVAADGYAGVAARAWQVQGQSPLYYLIVRAFSDVLGLSSWSLRFPSLLLGILLPWLGYRVTRTMLFDRRVALAAAIAMAVHAPLIRYSQEARPYALALALSLASFLLFSRVLRRGGAGVWAGYALMTAGAFYAHYLFGFAIAVQAAYAIWLRGTEARRAMPAIGIAALLMAPGGLQLANLFARRRSLDWTPDTTSLAEPLATVANAFFDPLPLALAALCSLALLGFGARIWRPEPESRPGLLLAWLLLPFVVFALLPSLIGVDLFHPRYLLFCAPAARIAVGIILALPRGHSHLDFLPTAVFAGATFAFVLLPYHADNGTFSDRKDQRWQAAVSALLEDHEPGDRVLLSTRFVEMDAITAGVAPESIREFASWPLTAHLPDDTTIPFTPLPYSLNESTRPILEDILRDATSAERVWILGSGASVDAIQAVVASNARFRFIRKERHGSIRLLLMTR
jgi:mannosyltransferase